jgi:hypothetical protein
MPQIIPPWDQEYDETDEEFYEKCEGEELLLRSGKYALIKYNCRFADQRWDLSDEGKEAYDEYMVQGETADVAFWRVVREHGLDGFRMGAYPNIALISKGCEKWVVVKRMEGNDGYDAAELVFERERCIIDLTARYLQDNGSITGEEFNKIRAGAERVDIIEWP